MADRAATLAAFREKYPDYAGISDDELGTRLASKYPKEYGFLAGQRVGETPVAPAGSKVENVPGVGSFLAKAAKERAGDIGATIATGLIPGGRGLLPLAERYVAPGVMRYAQKLVGPVVQRLAASEAGQDLGDLVAGNKVHPGWGAGTQLVGEGVTKAVAPMLSGIPFRAFARETAEKLANKLRSLVPAWSDLPANEKGLYEMAHGVGQRLLSRGYEAALQGVRGQIPAGQVVTMAVEDAAALGLKGSAAPASPWAVYQAKKAGQPLPQGLVQVELPQVIDALPSARKTDMGLYRRALRAADQGLENVQQGLGADFMGERSAYRTGAGFMEHAEKGKYLYGERFDPAAAQRAIDVSGKKSLLNRGMDDVRNIMRGPGELPIDAVKQAAWTRRLQGASLAELGGMPFGAPRGLMGVIGGTIGERLMPDTVYRNVPLTPAMSWAARIARPVIAEGAREGGRDLGVPEMLP